MPNKSAAMWLTLTLTPSLTSCSALPEILTGSLSAASAWYSYRAATAERVEVLSRDCIFAEQIRLDPALRPYMGAEDMRKIARHNLAVQEFCHEPPAP